MCTSKKHVKSICVGLGILAVIGMTYEAYQARSISLAIQAESNAYSRVTAPKLSADLALVAACREAGKESPVTMQRARDCLMTNMPKIQTSLGALVASTPAIRLLHAHPEDKAFQKTALAMIDTGWKWFLQTEQPSKLRVEKQLQRVNQSIFLRTAWGRQSYGHYLMQEEYQLQTAELALKAPDIKYKQNDRILKAAQSR